MPKPSTAATAVLNAVSKIMPDSQKVIRQTIEIPEPLFAKYEDAAIKNGRTVEEEISLRLKKCVDHDAIQPLYFDDDQRKALELATGWSARDANAVIGRLNEVSRFTVCDFDIEIPARLRTRLQSRVFRGQTFEDVIRKEVIQGLERFAGVRPY